MTRIKLDSFFVLSFRSIVVFVTAMQQHSIIAECLEAKA